jgi:thiopurine S-methyltransferase
MELSYWESRWRKDNTGFHMPGGYPGLKTHWNVLDLPDQPEILVPLCGKTEDLLFLESQNGSVTGVEISEKAILEFFEEHNRSYRKEEAGSFTTFRSGMIELWQGDFMKFPAKKKLFDLIYDKAALVALPPDKRTPYVEQLLKCTAPQGQLLLHHFIYPQNQMSGPPFSVTDKEIKDYFSDSYQIQILEEKSLPSDLFPPFQRRGLQSPLTERFLHLKPR